MKSALFLLSILVYHSLSCQTVNKFKNIAKEAKDSIPSLGSLLVWKDNALVCEEYFNGANQKTNFRVMSVTKSVVSALTGIAYDMKLLPDLKTPVLNLIPEYRTPNDSLNEKIVLRDLITMQSGYFCDDNNPVYRSPDPIRNILAMPFESVPGTKFRYCTAASNLFAIALSKGIKQNLKTFADSVLFKPIGIKIENWPSDNLGNTLGGSGLMMKPKDMIKFGLLFLNDGVVNGKQVISKAWIMESTSEQVILNEWDVLPEANGYGYYWWRRKINNHQAYVASGYGGQLICVIPDLKMIVVSTCFVNEKNRGRSEIKRLHLFIDKIVGTSD